MVYVCYMLYPFVKEGECDGKCVLCVVSIRREGVIWYTCMYVMCI